MLSMESPFTILMAESAAMLSFRHEVKRMLGSFPS